MKRNRILKFIKEKQYENIGQYSCISDSKILSKTRDIANRNNVKIKDMKLRDLGQCYFFIKGEKQNFIDFAADFAKEFEGQIYNLEF